MGDKVKVFKEIKTFKADSHSRITIRPSIKAIPYDPDTTFSYELSMEYPKQRNLVFKNGSQFSFALSKEVEHELSPFLRFIHEAECIMTNDAQTIKSQREEIQRMQKNSSYLRNKVNELSQLDEKGKLKVALLKQFLED